MHKLTDRQAQLLKIMSDERLPQTYAALGEQLGVSARTVMRELDACGGYLKGAGVSLERTSAGISLKGRQDGLEALRIALGKKTYVANSEQRLNLLKLELLQSRDPVKLYALSRKLGVAESTVSHDLDKAAAWLESYALRLMRRQGFGVLLEGGEANRRSALAGLIYDSLGDALLVRWLAGEDRLQQRVKEAFLPAWVDAATAADLILSTVACASERVEVLTVSPLLTDADKKRIDAWIDGRRPKRRAPSERDWQNRLVQINAFSEEMIQFLRHIFFVSCDAGNREALIDCAAAAIVSGNRKAITAALWEREKKGSVIVEEQQLLFLHARTDAVGAAYFGVLRPICPIFVDGKQVRIAVVMLIPLQATRSQVELLQKFTALIAEDEEFQLLLRRSTEAELQMAAEQICKQYFKEKFME